MLSPRKVTATAAATVLGCRRLAPEVDLRGVILNRVAGARHESVVRRAIEEHAGLPVLGALPKLADDPAACSLPEDLERLPLLVASGHRCNCRSTSTG